MILSPVVRPWRPVCLLLLILVSSLGDAHATDDPVPALDLRTALARTLTHSPALATFPWLERVADGELLQAGLQPNPVIAGEVENIAGTGELSGVDAAVVSLRLSQVVELGGKRDCRTGVALAQRDLLQADYELARLGVLAEATRRFIAVAREQALVELARQHRQVLVDTAAVAERRTEAGRSSPVEASQARIAAAPRSGRNTPSTSWPSRECGWLRPGMSWSRISRPFRPSCLRCLSCRPSTSCASRSSRRRR